MNVIESTENSFSDDELCNVMGRELVMENFREYCRIRKIPPYYSWKFNHVTVFRGIKIVMMVFSKEDEDLLRQILNESNEFKKHLAMNGSNPFI